MHGYKACTNVQLSKCALYVFKRNWIYLDLFIRVTVPTGTGTPHSPL